MRRVPTTSSSGFTLLEMLTALAVGLVITACAVQLFSSGMNATVAVSQRAQMQQDARAAEDALIKDIGLAGAGFQTGEGLATGTSVSPVYGCDQTPKCYLGTNSNASIAFPSNYLYPIQPGYQKGITLNGTEGPTDVITLTYTDNSFYLNCYNVTFNNTSGTSVNFVLPATALAGCSNSTTQKVTDAAVGLTAGDLVMFTNTAGKVAIAEVTAATGTATPYAVTFAIADTLSFNQPSATGGDLATLAATGAPAATAVRILVNTYFLSVLADPQGVGSGTPRLMRQTSGHTPVPLAENVAFLQFTYDTYDSSGNLHAGLGDAGASLGVSPALIRKVNIANMTFRSTTSGVKGYQGYNVQTSVSARNLSFSNRYVVQ